MGKSSKSEINIRRLLAQCEVMASDCQHNECKIDWRLAKVSSIVLCFSFESFVEIII